MAKAPLRPIPELSGGGVAACFGISGAAMILGWAGAALVCTGGTMSGGFTSLATGGAGVDVTVIGGGLVGAGFGWGGGTRLVMVVPTIISDRTLDRDGTGGAGAFAAGNA